MFKMQFLSFLTFLLGISATPSGARHLDRHSSVARAASVYPTKADGDAPYSIDEETLLSAINLPSGFTYGTKMPILLVPGTASTATETYSANFLILLSQSGDYDPVRLDIPDNSLNDVQLNSEYVAYAINYVSSISGDTSLGVITWSQGSLNAQWAFKYWPSTRAAVSDLVTISADLKGTKSLSALEESILRIFKGTITRLPPSFPQQIFSSLLLATLQNPTGGSAFVPTTSVYSGFDMLIQPQIGTSASAYFESDNGVAAADYQIQNVCPGQPAGGNYSHEGMLYNPFTYAIAIDALRNPGPGDASRLNLETICSRSIAEGLTQANKLLTDGAIVAAAINTVSYLSSYTDDTTEEPDIMGYARDDIPSGAKKVTVAYAIELLTGTKKKARRG